MKTTLKTALTVSLALPLSSCLLSKEEIEVHPDGSISVQHEVESDILDLPSGYAMPLGTPWTPTNEAARIWIRELGANTGSLAVQAASAVMDWATVFKAAGEDLHLGDDFDDTNNLRLTSEAEFASVDDWPRLYVPEDEPYRTAYLERSASLSIEDKGDQVVYVFERTYHGRRRAGLDLTERLGDTLSTKLVTEIPKEWLTDFRESLRQKNDLEPEGLTRLTQLLADGHADLYVNLTRHTFDMAFAQGSGALPLEAGTRSRAAVAAAMREVFSESYVSALWQRLIESSDGDENPLGGLEVDLRTILRDTVRETLSALETPEQAVNEVAFALEWHLTEYDHTTDLQDEEFEVAVSLPGTIVAGNYDSIREVDSRATWKFSAKDLMDRDRVLRVVSVVTR